MKWYPCVYTIPLTLGWGVEKEVGARLRQTQELEAGQMNWPWTETLR